MAKNKKSDDSEDSIWSDMAATVGGEILDKIEPIKSWIDTSSLALNYISSGKFIGGGIPSGRIIEIFGDSASGKSLLGMNILKGAQTVGGMAILLDAERAVSKDFAIKVSHIDPTKLIIMSGEDLKQCFLKIQSAILMARKRGFPMEKPIVIVYDSIAASPSEREHAETQVDMINASEAEIKRAGAGVDQPGDRARICSKYLRLLPAILEANNATLVIINQIRSKIGVMFGNPDTTAGGGKALEYYASSRFRLRANKMPKDKLGNVLGVGVTVTNVKNRCNSPYMDVKNLYLFFNQGMNPFGGLLELLIKAGRVHPAGSNGNYIVDAKYTNEQVVGFKASKERNDVPVDILLQYPKLVDAESKEQIQYYAELFGSAIDTTEFGIANESNISEEDLN